MGAAGFSTDRSIISFGTIGNRSSAQVSTKGRQGLRKIPVGDGIDLT
jgi:hypothetical protein